MVLGSVIIPGGSPYLGYKVGEKQLIDKVNSVHSIMEDNVKAVAAEYTNLQDAIQKINTAFNVTLENMFYLYHTHFMLSEAKRTVLEEHRLPKTFLEFYKVFDQSRLLQHQVLVGCEKTTADSLTVKWIITYRTPSVNPRSLYRSESFNIADGNCPVEYHGPGHVIHDPQTNQSCWAILDHSQANQPVIYLPDCVDREFSYKELERRNCRESATRESLDKIILRNSSTIIYCEKQVIVDDKLYKCPQFPFEIVSYNQPSPVEGRPTGRRIAFRNDSPRPRFGGKPVTIDYRRANVTFNIESVMPGLIHGPNFSKIKLKEIPRINGTDWRTVLKEAIPDALHTILLAITSFSVFRFLFSFKFIRLIGYMPLVGGLLFWYHTRTENKKHPEPSAPPHSSLDQPKDHIMRFH